jgi:hypothetical protein
MKKLVAVLMIVCLAGAAQAALIYSDVGGEQGGSSLGWDVTTIWNPDQTPSAGNDYVISQGDMVRSPDNDDVFGGDSLQVQGNLGLKNIGVTSVDLGVNLYLDGGALEHFDNDAAAGRLWTFSSGYSMTIRTNSTMFNRTGGAKGHLQWANTWYGSADLSGAYTARTHTNYFDGADLQNYTGDLVGNDFTSFVFDSNPNSEGGLDLSSGATLIMNSNIKFESLTIDGNAVADGSYTAAELTALGHGGNFSGTGSFTVNIPEPTTVGLIGIGLIGCAIGRRKVRK